jgi:hypothetical protein
MTSDQLKNLAWYALYALGGALITTGVQFGVVLTGTGDIEWRPLAATFVTALFGALATAAGSATRPRTGSEPIAQKVNALREMGYHRDDLTVVPKADRRPDLDAAAERGTPLVVADEPEPGVKS